MIKLNIIKKENFIYTLSNESNNYELRLEFNDLTFEPVEGDIIYMNPSLLNIDYLIAFGTLGSEYGREIIDVKDPDIIALCHDGERYFLKRIYG